MFLGKNSRSPMNQQAIAELPGLGPMSAAMLAGVGITSVAQLKRLGSVRAYARVKASKRCLNLASSYIKQAAAMAFSTLALPVE
ncbi:MAG: hypothetical protein EBX71_05180 [Betaproteobacteria bacterium]|nr:hypothetical protein [Betaproteobacteria bacterium]NCZ75566.1 hypothetical protein [Betaproteobacteria bacterium]NDB10973.1 hypothetical protein [Betaproteobacteria bacterium]